MTYIARLSERARVELQIAHDWWAVNRSAIQAERWYDRFVAVLDSISADPDRFARAPESLPTDCVVREAHFGLGKRATHRALFTIRDNSVVVLSIRHSSQRNLNLEELSVDDPAP